MPWSIVFAGEVEIALVNKLVKFLWAAVIIVRLSKFDLRDFRVLRLNTSCDNRVWGQGRFGSKAVLTSDTSAHEEKLKEFIQHRGITTFKHSLNALFHCLS